MSDKQTTTTANHTACGSKLNNSMGGEGKAKRDVYQDITDKIIAALEKGTAPWVKPWASSGAPRNAVTGREYSGINLVLLAMSTYTSPLWLTYNQAAAVGGQVRKGQHGTAVVLYKPFAVKDAEAEGRGEDKEKVIPLLRTFTVFNVEQIDGLPTKYTDTARPHLDSFTDNDEAEALLAIN